MFARIHRDTLVDSGWRVNARRIETPRQMAFQLPETEVAVPGIQCGLLPDFEPRPYRRVQDERESKH